jgi:hypothetical protein
MTNEEFNKTYGDVELTFCGYYKYQFSFTGIAPDGTNITAWYGGSSDQIYRYEVSRNSTQKIGSIEDNWMQVHATQDDTEIFSYHDY